MIDAIAVIQAEAQVAEIMRLALAWGRVAGGPEFYGPFAEEEWAALDAAVRKALNAQTSNP